MYSTHKCKQQCCMHSETNITFVTLNLVGNNGAICKSIFWAFYSVYPSGLSMHVWNNELFI